MPIIRKLLNLGDSKAVTLPKSWLANAEANAEYGKKIVALALEVNGVITITPVFSPAVEPKIIHMDQ
jgi:hypothetical protein